jgi:DNA repair photolyase
MPECGSQVAICDVPIRFDTYEGCSHGCKYCFVQKKAELCDIKKGESINSLIRFINGERGKKTNWCDWNIPLHWGGTSDPFQPVEKTFRYSYEALKVFAETQYPFIVSTKGKLVAEPEYLELLGKCNCVVQISMACSIYDKIEPGCPNFEERLIMLEKVAKVARVNVRVQPYMIEAHEEIKKNIERFAKAGAYGVIFEGMKFARKQKGLVKVGSDMCYPIKALKPRFEELKRLCHKYGLKFYSGENRLRKMGDSLCCCGIDGMQGFQENKFNINHFVNGDTQEPTQIMQRINTADCWNGKFQAAGVGQVLKTRSFYDMMITEYKTQKQYYENILSLKADK